MHAGRAASSTARTPSHLRVSSPGGWRRLGVALAVTMPCFLANLLVHAADRTLAGEAWITNQTGNSASVVTIADMKVAAVVKLDGKPAGIAHSPDGATTYVTAPEGHELLVVDAATRTLTKRVAIGQAPLGLAVHPRDGRIFIADWFEHKIRVLPPAATGPATEIAVGQSPSGVALTPDGALALTADRDSNEVSVIDTRTLTRLHGIKVGERPFGVTVDASGQWAFTANVGSDDVSVIDIAGRQEIGRVKVGRRPYAVALAGRRAFVTDQYGGTVTVFGLGSLNVIATIPVGDHPEGIAADAEGAYVYVACWLDNELVKIDAATLKVVGRVAVGDGPRAFGSFLR